MTENQKNKLRIIIIPTITVMSLIYVFNPFYLIRPAKPTFDHQAFDECMNDKGTKLIVSLVANTQGESRSSVINMAQESLCRKQVNSK